MKCRAYVSQEADVAFLYLVAVAGVALKSLEQTFLKLARSERFELPTSWFVARHSIQLSYERTSGAHATTTG
jgi:hypothetical protein